MILDTSFLRELKDSDQDALSHARGIESLDAPLRIPAPVCFEWFFGVQYVQNPVRDQQRFQQLVANKPFQELTGPIARKAGTLNAVHEQSETKPNLEPIDSMVAATGLQLNEPVVATDGDFETVDGLRVSMP